VIPPEELEACRNGDRATLVTYRCAGERNGKVCRRTLATVYRSRVGPLFLATWTEPTIGGVEGWRSPAWRVRKMAPALADWAANRPKIPDQANECAELVADGADLRMKCRYHPLAVADRGGLEAALREGMTEVLVRPA
jgi:hypothetical protein